MPLPNGRHILGTFDEALRSLRENVLLMAGLPIMNWIRFFVWLAIGLVIYLLYSRRHSEFAPRKFAGLGERA